MDAITEITMESLPPKTLKTQLVRLDNNLKQIERSHFAGIQRAPGSLPVLEAFQDFLNMERRKARRRMLALSAFFVVLLLTAAGAGTGIVFWQMKCMAVDYDNVTARTKDLNAKLISEDETTRASLAELESRLESENQGLIQRHEKLLSAHTTIAEQILQDGTSLTAIQETLDRLASENAALKEDLDRVMKDWPSVSQQVQALEGSKPSPAQPRVTQPREASVVASTEVAPVLLKPSPPRSQIALTIVPQGEQHGIRWRLPVIPE